MSLPRELTLSSPILMSGMSMLYAMILCPKQSEEWYQELVTYEKNAPNDSATKKEAKIRIAYLNIALPNRGIHGIIKIMKNTAILALQKNISLPEFSVTSNIPSVMNGGLDFCEWSKNDKELAIILKKPVELVLGKYGVGLVNVAIAESGFIKGTMSSYEITTRLNTAYFKADISGKIEMCFAATGLMVREHLANGQFAIGKSLMDSFYEKAKRENAKQLLKNIQAYEIWLNLIKGETGQIREWLNTAPNENIAFCILDRYQYMIKIRCYIALKEPQAALGLIERLNVYFTEYERNYLWMENQVLKAIVLYRMNNKEWEKILTAVLKKMEKYQFIRIIAEEGNAVKPLLDKLKYTSVEPQFYKRLCEEVNKMAIFFPLYLKEEKKLSEALTETEKKIIKLLCDKLSSKEICKLCCISYSGLKFHNSNIYRKLGVNNRNDAELEAQRLGLDK